MYLEEIEDMINNAIVRLACDDPDLREHLHELIEIDGMIDELIDEWIDSGVSYAEVLDVVGNMMSI